MTEIINRIIDIYPKLSKGNKKVAQFIMDHFQEVIFMTAAEMAQKLEISESTIVRFPKNIGLKGYPELIAELRMVGKDQLQKALAPNLTAETYDNWGVIASVMQADINKIHDTLSDLDGDVFGSIIDAIIKGKRVYILGLRNCAPLATFLYFYLNKLRPDVILLDSSASSEIFEQMFRISEEDVIIGISFPRYSMRTLKAMELANDRGAKVIAITDRKTSPINLYSSMNLLAKSEMTSVAESLVAPLSILNAIIVAVSLKMPEKALDELNALENTWINYQPFDKDEMDFLEDNFEFAIKKATSDDDFG